MFREKNHSDVPSYSNVVGLDLQTSAAGGRSICSVGGEAVCVWGGDAW